MKLKLLQIIGTVLLFALGASIFADQPRVAVLGFRPENGLLSDHLSAAISSAIVKTRSMTLVERSQLDLILKELKLTESGVIDQDGAGKLGAISGVKYLIYGTIISFTNDQVQVSNFIGSPSIGYRSHIEARVRVTDVGTGVVLFDELAKGSSEKSGESAALADAAWDFARKFMKLIPPVEAEVVDVDTSAKVVRIEPDKLAGVQPGDLFVLGVAEERVTTTGKKLGTFKELTQFQVTQVGSDNIEGIIGKMTKDQFLGKSEFRRSDAYLLDLEQMVKDGKKVVARPILE